MKTNNTNSPASPAAAAASEDSMKEAAAAAEARRKLGDRRAAGAGPIVRMSATLERAIVAAGPEQYPRKRDTTPEGRAAVAEAAINVEHLLYAINDYLATFMSEDARGAFEALHTASGKFYEVANAEKNAGKGVQ